MTHPNATVVWLRDASGAFPHAVFDGDTDAGTAGWISCTAASRTEIVIAPLTPGEWNDGYVGTLAALERVHFLLNRRDLSLVRLIRLEVAASANAMSFQKFRQNTTHRHPIYSALHGSGESLFEREESPEIFQINGGIFTVLSDIDHGIKE